MVLVEHYVRIGANVRLGGCAYVGSRAKISDHLVIPGGAVVPQGAILRTQSDVDRVCGRAPQRRASDDLMAA